MNFMKKNGKKIRMAKSLPNTPVPSPFLALSSCGKFVVRLPKTPQMTFLP
jgi:hypothetical protein